MGGIKDSREQFHVVLHIMKDFEAIDSEVGQDRGKGLCFHILQEHEVLVKTIIQNRLEGYEMKTALSEQGTANASS